MTAAPAAPPRSILRDGVRLLLLAAVPALLTGWLHPKHPAWSWTRPAVAEVALGDVTRWPLPVLWIDARSENDFRARHIPGAVLLNEENWDRLLPGFLAAWQPQARLVVYCDSTACDASQAVARRLQQELNLDQIHVLRGGWTEWLKANR